MRARLFLPLRDFKFRPAFKKCLKVSGAKEIKGTDYIKFTLLFEDKGVK